jgi:hypothetical protein
LFPAHTTITDLLERVSRRRAAPAGHADPHTAGLYDQRKGKITRNFVEGSRLSHQIFVFRMRIDGDVRQSQSGIANPTDAIR